MSEPTKARYSLSQTLHILRNQYGWSEETLRAVRLQAADMLESLSAALAEAQRDAERWRHIRNGPQAWHKEQGLDWWGIELAFTEGSDKFSALDAWIDKAIAAERAQGRG